MAHEVEPWSDEEKDQIGDDYLDILCYEIKGRPYAKRARAGVPMEASGWCLPSIECKRQNISAVVEILGLSYIDRLQAAQAAPGEPDRRGRATGVNRRRG